jgi:hypothetical protein
VKKILKTKVKVGKITQEQYKISVDAVNTRTLITKAQFKTEVSGLNWALVMRVLVLTASTEILYCS